MSGVSIIQKLRHKIGNLPQAIQQAESDLHDELINFTVTTLKSGRLFYNLGYLQYIAKDFKNSKFNIEKALDICLPILTDDSEEVIDMHYVYARVLSHSKNSADIDKSKKYHQKIFLLRDKHDSQKTYEKSLETTMLSEISKFRIVDSTLIYADAADIARSKGDYEYSSLLYSKALVYRRPKFGDDDESIPILLINYAQLQVLQGHLIDAKMTYDEALPLHEKLYGRFCESSSSLLREIALLHIKMDNFSVADSILNECLSILRALYGEVHTQISIILNDLAELYREDREYAKAIGHHEAAILCQSKLTGPNHSITQQYKDSLNITLRRKGRQSVPDVTFFGDTFEYLRRKTVDPKNPLLFRYTVDDIVSIGEKFIEGGCAHQAIELYDIITNKKKLTDSRANISLPKLSPSDIKTIAQARVSALYSSAVQLSSKGDFQKAKELFQQCLSSPKDVLKQPSLLYDVIYLATAENLLILGHFEDSHGMIIDSLKARMEKYGGEHILTSEATLLLAEWNLATARYEDAHNLSSQVITFMSEALGKEPDTFFKSMNATIPIYTRLLINSARSDYERGNYNSAQSTLAQLVALSDKVSIFKGRDHPLLVDVLVCRGLLECTFNNFADARRCLEEGLEIANVCFSKHHMKVGVAMKALGILDVLCGEYSSAAIRLENAYSILRCQVLENHPHILETSIWRSKLNLNLGRHSDAYTMVKRCMIAAKKNLTEKHPLVISSLLIISESLRLDGDASQGKALIEEALDLTKSILHSPDNIHMLFLESGYYLGLNAISLGEYHSAVKYFEHNISSCKAFMSDHRLEWQPIYNSTVMSLISVYLELGMLTEAIKHADTLSNIRDNYTEESITFGSYLYTLGEIKLHHGKYDEAKSSFSKSLLIRQKHFGNDHPLIATTLIQISEALRWPGYYDESLKANSVALQLRQRLFGDNNIWTSMALISNARIKVEAGFLDNSLSEQSLQKVLINVKDKLGHLNFHFISSTCEIAECFRLQDKYQLALQTCKQALNFSREFFKEEEKNNTLTLRITHEIASCLHNLRKPYEALVLLKNEVLPSYEAIYGKNHPIVVNTRSRIGLCLNEVRDGVGQTMIDASLDFFDTYPHGPFSSKHPWVQELGGYYDESSGSRSSRSDSDDDTMTNVDDYTPRSNRIDDVSPHAASHDTIKPVHRRGSPRGSVDKSVLSKDIADIANFSPQLNTVPQSVDDLTNESQSSSFMNIIINHEKPNASTDDNMSPLAAEGVYDATRKKITEAEESSNSEQDQSKVIGITPRARQRDKALEAADYLAVRAEELHLSGNYAKATTILEECLIMREANIPMSDVVSNTLFLLAENHRLLGRYQQAHERYHQALDIRILYHGRKSLPSSEILIGIGHALHDEGFFHKAEIAYKEAFDIRLQIKEEKESDINSSRNELTSIEISDAMNAYLRGLNFAYMSEYSTAKDLLTESAVTFNKLLGQDHINNSYPVFGNAELLRLLGRYDEAKVLYELSLSILQQHIVYHTHPLMLTCQRKLAVCLQYQGAILESYKMLTSLSLPMMEYFSEDNIILCNYNFDVACNLSIQCKYSEALALHEKVFHIRKANEVSSEGHLSSSYTLCESLIEMARNQIHLTFYHQAKSKLADCEKYLSELFPASIYPHAKTVLPMYAEIYQLRAQILSAVGLYHEAIKSYHSAMTNFSVPLNFVTKNDDFILPVLSIHINIAIIIRDCGHYYEAAKYFNLLQANILKSFGSEHYEYLRCRAGYGECLRRLGHYSDAKQIMLECLKTCMAVYNLSLNAKSLFPWTMVDCQHSLAWLSLDEAICDPQTTDIFVELGKITTDVFSSKYHLSIDVKEYIPKPPSNRPIIIKHDEHGLPIFENQIYTSTTRNMEAIVDHLEHSQFSSFHADGNNAVTTHPYITFIRADINIIMKLEHEAKQRFIMFLSPQDRKLFHKSSTLLHSSSHSALDMSSITKINDPIANIKQAIEVLGTTSSVFTLNPAHLWIRKLQAYSSIVIQQPSFEQLQRVESTYTEAERLRSLGRFGDADRLYSEVLELEIDTLSPLGAITHSVVADTLLGKAECYRHLGYYEVAKILYTFAIDIYRRVATPANPNRQIGETVESLDTAKASFGLAELMRNQGLISDALLLHEQILTTRMGLVNNDNNLLAESIIAITSCLIENGHYSAARKMIDKAHKLLASDQSNPASKDIYNEQLSNLYLVMGRLDMLGGSYLSSSEYLEKSIELRKQRLGMDDHPKIDEIVYYQAHLKYTCGKYSSAKKLIKQCIDSRMKFYGNINIDELILKDFEDGRIQRSLKTLDDAGNTHYSDTIPKPRLKVDDGEDDVRNTLETAVNFGKEVYNESEIFESPGKERDNKTSSPDKSFKFRGEDYCNHSLIAEALRMSGDIHISSGDYVEAKEYLQASASIYRCLHGQSLTHTSISSYSAAVLFSVGNLVLAIGNHSEALRIHTICMQQRQQVLGNDHPDRAESLSAIATINCLYGKYNEAKNHLVTAMKVICKVYQSSSSEQDSHPKIADILHEQGCISRLRGEYDTAYQTQQKCLTIYRSFYHETHPKIATCMLELSHTLYETADYTSALKSAEQALSMRQLLFGEKHMMTLQISTFIGVIYCSLGRVVEGSNILEDSHIDHRASSSSGIYGTYYLATYQSLLKLARCCITLGQYSKAKTYLLTCHKIFKKYFPDLDNNLLLAETVALLGDILKSEGSYEQAMTLYEQALTIRRSCLPDHHPLIGNVLRQIADICLSQSEFDKAKEIYDECLAVYQQAYPQSDKQHDCVGDCLESMAKMYFLQGKFTDSKIHYEKSLSVKKAVFLSNDHVSLVDSQIGIALVNKQCGKGVNCLNVLEKCYNTLKVAYGQKSPSVSKVLQTMGECAISVGEYTLAMQWLIESLSIKQLLYSHVPHHIEFGDSFFSIGECLYYLGQYYQVSNVPLALSVTNTLPPGGNIEHAIKVSTAFSCYEQALKHRLEYYPAHHPIISRTELGIAGCLLSVGKYKAAHALHINVLTNYLASIGEHHPDTLYSMLSLAECLRTISKVFPAEEKSEIPIQSASSYVQEVKSLLSPGEDSLIVNHFASILELNPQLIDKLVPDIISPTAASNTNNTLNPVNTNQKNKTNATTLNSKKKKGQNLHTEHSHKGNLGYHLSTSSSLPSTASVSNIQQSALQKGATVVGHGTDGANANSNTKSQNKIQFDNPKWLCEKVIIVTKKQYDDENHPLLASAYFLKAEIYRQRKHPEHALPLYEQTQSVLTQCYRVDNHPLAGLTYNSLGELYRAENNQDMAMIQYQKAIAIFKLFYKPLDQANGNNLATMPHPNVADVESNIAMLLYSQGKYQEALPLFQSSLSIREKSLGTFHPSVAQSLNNYAGLLHTLGKYAEALPMYKKSLEIKIHVYNSKIHSDVASSMNNLGLLLKSQLQYEEAEFYYDSALDIQKKLYGDDMKHSHIASTLNNKASLYVAQNRKVEAKELYYKVIELKRAIYGEDDPAVASSLNNLGGLVFNMGEVEDARVLYEESLRIRVKKFGNEHISVAESLNNIGLLMFSKGNFKEALENYEQALKIKISIFGENHASTASSMHNLAGLLHKMKRFDEAYNWYSKAYAIRRRAHGDNHPDTLASLDNMNALEIDKRKAELKRKTGQEQKEENRTLPNLVH